MASCDAGGSLGRGLRVTCKGSVVTLPKLLLIVWPRFNVVALLVNPLWMVNSEIICTPLAQMLIKMGFCQFFDGNFCLFCGGQADRHCLYSFLSEQNPTRSRQCIAN